MIDRNWLWVGAIGLLLGSSYVHADAVTNPGFKKVFVIILENEDSDNALKQPFLGSLAKRGGYLSDYHAITHPSQPNYLALISGDTQGVFSDGTVDLNAKHLGDLIEGAGKQWKSYAEAYPGGCDLDGRVGTYARKHEPFLDFQDVQTDPQRCARVVNADQLATDIQSGTLPDFSLYVPDLNNDGHDTDVGYADRWLQNKFGPLSSDPKFMNNLLLVVTFDEGSWLSSNRIYTVLYGDAVQPGSTDGTRYDHYSLLRTIEDALGLGNLGANDAGATPITGVWK